MMYLKYYYFKEFMTIALSWATSLGKVLSLTNEARKNGIQVLAPD
jgi:DNA polymerase III alpha subunit